MSIYKYTFRFNASHSNTNDLTKVHTHSFVVSTFVKYHEHMAYNKMEMQVKEYLSQFKGKCMNDFLEKEATIENMGDYLFAGLDEIIGNNDLVTLELSDSPIQLLRIRREE